MKIHSAKSGNESDKISEKCDKNRKKNQESGTWNWYFSVLSLSVIVLHFLPKLVFCLVFTQYYCKIRKSGSFFITEFPNSNLDCSRERFSGFTTINFGSGTTLQSLVSVTMGDKTRKVGESRNPY